MLNSRKALFNALATAVVGCAGMLVQVNATAQHVNDVPNPRQQEPADQRQIDQRQAGQSQQETVDADDFINQASAKNLAEIETSKLALEKASSQEVKDYAQKLIKDHQKANQQLKQLAQKKNVELADDPALMDQAKAAILEQRDESFDEAYANNQVAAHEQTIELFEQASRSNDPDVRSYANKILPQLRHHLEKARELADVTDQDDGNV